ncbi:MAG: histidine kinase [Acidimicrobiales bacterium]
MAGSAGWPSIRIRPRAAGLVATLVATAVTCAVVVGTARLNQDSVERTAPVFWVVLGLIGVAAIVLSAWALWVQHPPVCAGLAVLVAGALVPSVAGWPTAPAALRADALAAGPLAVAGVALVHERWRSGRRGAPLLITSSLALAAVVVHVIGYDPFKDPSCRRICAEVVPMASGVVSTHVAVLGASSLTTAACAVALIAAFRERRTRPPRLITYGVVAALVVLGGSAAVRARSWAHGRPSALSLVLSPAACAFAIGSAVLVVALRNRRTRMAVQQLALRLAEPELSLFGSAVRGIQFAVPGDDRWVDENGRDVHTDVASEFVVVPDESGPALRLLVPRRTDAVDVVAAFTPVARLALMNARLAAVTRARLSDVTESRRRVVAAADAERRRIERDLHDGAQQRLVSASFHLSVARGRLPEEREELLAAESNLRDALAQLRELAHGLFPSVITTEGLGPALEDLVRESEVAATLDMANDCVVAGETALAVYATVVAALDAARASNAPRAHVSVCRRDSTIIAAVVTGPLIDTDLVDAADRVGAVGGRLSLSTVDHETTVTAEFPCA